MNVIKLATVFSGIGAIEQAIKQMNIEHKIVFACDNGERYLEKDVDQIEEDFKKIKKIKNFSLQEYVNELYEKTGKINNVKKSYFANYDINDENWYEDIRFLDGKKYKGKVDLFVGGSPCQSFSTYGHRKGLEDTRGTLFYDYARLVQEIKPKVFIFENVTGLLNHDGGKTWKIIKETFDELHYKINMEVLNASDFNLPQLRKRVFVVGVREDLNFSKFKFPNPLELTKKSKDFLEKEVDNKYYLGEKGFKFVTDPSRNGRRARVNQDILGCQTANQQFNWVGDFRVEKPLNRHLEDKKIFKGIYNGELSVARKMVPIELLRLMGFKDFNIVVEDKVIWRQTGNSIAVPVLKEIMKEIILQFKL